MITGTVGVSPVRLLNPGVGRRGTHTEGLSVAGRDNGGQLSPPSVFVVELDGPHGRVQGLVVSVDVRDPPTDGGLFPHEDTDTRAVRRRARALQSATLDRDPVMLTYRGRGRAIGLARADISRVASGVDGRVQMTVSSVGAGTVAEVMEALVDQRFLVADGHHRLAATVELVRSRRTAAVTGFIVDADDTPLSLRAIHRIVLDRNGRELVGDAAVSSALNALRRTGAHISGPSGRGHESEAYVGPPASCDATLLHTASRWTVSWGTASAADVAWKVERALTQLGDFRVRREPDVAAGERAADRGALTVLLPTPQLDDVVAMAERGLVLPYKTTLFEPKLPPGALVRPLFDA